MTAAPMAPVAAKFSGAESSDFDDKASDDDACTSEPESQTSAQAGSRPRTQRELPAPNRQMSPFDVRFSQMRARHEFRDGKLLEDSVQQIRIVRPEGESDAPMRLEAPFPPIEVLQWRCKLRDESTGRPKLDPDTGEELWDTSDRWFTLDNRRLYCLQKAAIAAWPERVVMDVVELPPGPLTRIRELKKFRTLDRGRSVMIGGRQEGETLTRWSWREAVGLSDDHPSDDAADDASASDASNSFDNNRVRLRQQRRRPPGRGGGRGGGASSGPASGSSRNSSGGSRRPGGASSDKAESGAAGHSNVGKMSWGSLVVFLGIYVALRFGTKLAMAISGKRAGKETTEAGGLPPATPVSTALLTGGAAALLAAGAVHVVRLRMQ